jgi:glucose/arabinose dehydrogenase
MTRLLILLFVVVLAACSADDGIMVTPPVSATEPVEVTAPVDLPPVTAVTNINLAPIVTEGLTDATYLTHAGDNRLFVVEKVGRIRIIQDEVLLSQPFLDISERVESGSSERGLLSVAFHPNYAENGNLFVNYTNNDGDTVISRFQVTADPNLADAANETILLTIPQPFPNHNGGQVKFGPDGYLYVGMGDGGAAADPQGNGQNAGTLLGAMLRLDVDGASSDANYAVPADNPFINSDGRNEIWATGVRNPWRFSFDRLTGDLFIADVGQNVWEEVSVQPATSAGGENYGWDILEGSHCFSDDTCDSSGTVLPIYEYQHENGRCSITGGYVYRGAQFLALTGNYFFGDYCTGEIWALAPAGNGSWSVQFLLDTNFRISSFGEDATGEIYVIDLQGGVYQIQQ